MIQLSTYKTHYKETIRLGVPIILGQLGIIVVGFADNIMVGHHSSNELAAASFVNNFFNLIFIAGMGFSYGLTPIIGNLFALKEYAKAGETLKNSLLLNFFISILFTLIMLFFLLHIEILEQPKELIPLIKPYYILQLVSIPLVMPFNSFKQFSDGTTDTITPMWIMLSSNLLNIIGNYLLIYGYLGFPELGLTGAGISTLFSRIVSLLLFVILFMKQKRFKIYLSGFKEGIINLLDFKKLTQIGLPVAALMAVETGSFSLSVIMMGWLGSSALAAHQIVSVITTLGFMVYYGIGAAITIRVSSFKGKNDWKNIRNATFAGLHLVIITAFFVVLLIVSFRDSMGYLFTSQKEVVELVALLAWSVILYQFGDGLQVTFANALRGIADVKQMAYIACFCHIGLALPIGYLCGFILDWGPFGVWCGFPISLTTLGILLWIRFNKLTIKN
jgi:MATE family multidrug resistance protein